MRRDALVLFLLSFAVYLAFHPGRTLTADSAVTLDTVRALHGGHLDIPENLVARQGRDGKYYSKYGPLLPALALPAFSFGALFDTPPTTPAEHRYGWGDWLALATNQWVTALILVMLYATGLALGVSRKESLLVAVVAGFTTTLFPYSVDFFTQSAAALGLAVTALGLVRFENRGDTKSLAWASLGFGVAVLARMDMIALGPGFFLWGFWAARRKGVQLGRTHWLAACLPFLICLVLLLLFDTWRWGQNRGVAYSNVQFSTPLIDSLPRFFFSWDIGFFTNNPVLFLSLTVLPFLDRKRAPMLAGVGIASLAYLLLVSKFMDFHGGVCPGPRYLLVLVPFWFLPLLAALADRPWNWRRWLYGPLALLGLVGLLINGYEARVDYTQTPRALTYWTSLLEGNGTGDEAPLRTRRESERKPPG